MWVSYDIMNELGGSIALKSVVGKGTAFTVRIPAVVPER
ncbi:MAG: HAMP domain-containing histidine kinase [Deltaproteobacteria bacterium]|nr:HAMP domain-containing histidine kinase [Deltaproteobacteria bacterium]MBW1817915.1 HAMP domain-containing histidine kinase [Deltaproteobacteria bacterium]MBW2284914.1 HAMP domain-containing histidine kinase [Deltaproteobacteria bacterium]